MGRLAPMTCDGRKMTIRKSLTGVFTALSILFGSSHSAFAWFGALGVNGDIDLSDATNSRLCQVSLQADGSRTGGLWA